MYIYTPYNIHVYTYLARGIHVHCKGYYLYTFKGYILPVYFSGVYITCILLRGIYYIYYNVHVYPLQCTSWNMYPLQCTSWNMYPLQCTSWNMYPLQCTSVSCAMCEVISFMYADRLCAPLAWHPRMSQITHVYESGHTHMNESDHTYEWGTSHI